MIGNTGRDGDFIYRLHESIVRFERVNAISHAIKLSGCGIGDQNRLHCSVNRVEQAWSSYERGSDAANPARSQLTAAMRRRNKDDAFYFWAMIEDKRFSKQLTGFASQMGPSRRRTEEIAPDPVAGVGYHQATNHSTHAVADEYDPFLTRKFSLNSVEVTAKKHRRIRIGIATWVTEKPKLIVCPDPRVLAQGIDHGSPTRGCRL